MSQSFERQPDVVTGVATSTTAGVELVEQLTEMVALNLAKSAAQGKLLTRLKAALSRSLQLTNGEVVDGGRWFSGSGANRLGDMHGRCHRPFVQTIA